MAARRKTRGKQAPRKRASKKATSESGGKKAPRKRASKKATPKPGGKQTGKRKAAAAPAPAPGAGSTSVGPEVRPRHPSEPDLVVGVGASAGGLAAFRDLVAGIPADSGLCVLLVSHLAPDHKSMLAELLSGSSALPVSAASSGTRLERNQIFVIPPGRLLEITNGHLGLVPRPKDQVPLPVDHLFRSLAEHYGSRAVGVVLSGTASDGTEGLRQIKAAGGLAIAQDPSTAEYDGMPLAAIRAGAVDVVLAIPEIVGEVLKARSRPHVEDGDIDGGDSTIRQIFGRLRGSNGVDFSQYKAPTVRRRLQRRMLLRSTPNLADYAALLERDAEEVARLEADILIQVTHFFREPESFEMLADEVLPAIFERRPRDEPVRIWVPGCATGEDAYSLAIVLLEVLRDRTEETPFQIFATDVSGSAIDCARAGLYSKSIAASVSPERLRRFFSRSESGYRVSPSVREHCIFARHDLTRDPPFSRLDLILCRNLLIYLRPAAQQRAIRLFHYALRADGYLLLGESETIGDQGSLFALAGKRHKLYVRRRADAPPPFQPGGVSPGGPVQTPSSPTMHPIEASDRARRLLLERYARPAVVIEKDMQIVESLGHTGRYLELSPGVPSLSLLKMARPGLAVGMRAAIEDCRKRNAPSRRRGLRLETEGKTVRVDVEAIPLGATNGVDRYLVVFDEVREPEAAQEGSARSRRRRKARGKDGGASESVRLHELEEELRSNREQTRIVIQDLEAANEELQSANEEVLSSNEELRSTNEELDTAREELQSTNEEIGTVNEELRGRNEDLVRVNSDLHNLLENAQLAIVIVSRELRIRHFTPRAEHLLNIIPSDLGRPIGQIRPNLEIEDLERTIRHVVERVEPFESEVRGDRGRRWLSLRIRPYKDIENRIDGAVLSLLDVTPLKTQEQEAARARELADAIVDSVRDSLLLLDADLRVTRANDAFYAYFRVRPEETIGSFLWELGNGQWNIPGLRQLLLEVLPKNTRVDDFAVEHDFPGLGRRRVSVSARRLRSSPQEEILLALRFEGI